MKQIYYVIRLISGLWFILFGSLPTLGAFASVLYFNYFYNRNIEIISLFRSPLMFVLIFWWGLNILIGYLIIKDKYRIWLYSLIYTIGLFSFICLTYFQAERAIPNAITTSAFIQFILCVLGLIIKSRFEKMKWIK